jgi:hypothetical protein
MSFVAIAPGASPIAFRQTFGRHIAARLSPWPSFLH